MKLCIHIDIASTSKLQNARIYTTVGTYRIRVHDVRKAPRCRMSESKQLYAQMSHASNTRRCPMSESITLLAQIDAIRGQEPVEDASLERPRMHEVKEVFCQIAFEGYKV